MLLKEALDMAETAAKRTSRYRFTHHPGDSKSEKRLADLKTSVKGSGNRVHLKGRLGKDNPNATKYHPGHPDFSRNRGSHPHQTILQKDAAHFDVYVHPKNGRTYS